ncbi:MAG: hypothetical protein E6I01_01000 [Chloroflexi bacterium]|nr:MAG: hypothetical protein E6I01_01000 [Chloroflexota bacterium]
MAETAIVVFFMGTHPMDGPRRQQSVSFTGSATLPLVESGRRPMSCCTLGENVGLARYSLWFAVNDFFADPIPSAVA